MLKTENDFETFAIRLLEIQTRIANLRLYFGWTEKPSQVSKTEPKVEKTIEDPQEARNKELDDIKAKLLGKKK